VNHLVLNNSSRTVHLVAATQGPLQGAVQAKDPRSDEAFSRYAAVLLILGLCCTMFGRALTWDPSPQSKGPAGLRPLSNIVWLKPWQHAHAGPFYIEQGPRSHGVFCRTMSGSRHGQSL
jgi:hypothetical protein